MLINYYTNLLLIKLIEFFKKALFLSKNIIYVNIEYIVYLKTKLYFL